MNLLRIIRKEFRQSIRDWRANALMILLPLVLMTILGAALSRVFGGTIDLDASALYTASGTGPIPAAFDAFTGRIGAMGVRFTGTDDAREGLESVKDSVHACYVVVTDTGITLYKNDRFNFQANFVQSALQAFLQRYNAVRAIAVVNPASVVGLSAEPAASAVEKTSVVGLRQPRAFDYYAVTMLTFVVMLASTLGMAGIRKELKLRTAFRILAGPVTRGELLAGKLTGGLFVTMVQVVIVIVFSHFAIGAYWGHDIGAVLLVLFAQAVMAVGLGAGVAFLIRNDGAAIGILNSIFPVLVLFGGGYGPLEGTGPVFRKIADLDPITWVNRAIFSVIYDRDFSSVATAVLFCLGVAAVFLAAAALVSRKEMA